jgi:uncharacterized Zn finger protein (UPF0148 family)
MTSKKLETFKIGDTKKPGIAKPAKAPSAESNQKAQSESHTLGFRRIETLLEQDEAVDVSEKINKLLQSLEEFAQKAKTNKDKAAAKKAIIAVERTADLLDYLFQTKAQMQQHG